MTWVSETSLESEAISYNISNESCAAWISRDGLSSGIAGLQVELQNCAVEMPEVRDHATYLGDLLVIFHDSYNIYFLCLPVVNCNPPERVRVCYILWWHPKHSRYVKDFLYNEQREPLIWEDGESGRKCAVALLTQEARDRACG